MVKVYEESLAERLGYNLTQRRSQLGLTQDNVIERAELKNTVTLARYEAGKTIPSLVTLEKLAKALSTTMVELLGERRKLAPLPTNKKFDACLQSLEPDDATWVFSVVEQLLKRCRPNSTKRVPKS